MVYIKKVNSEANELFFIFDIEKNRTMSKKDVTYLYHLFVPERDKRMDLEAFTSVYF